MNRVVNRGGLASENEELIYEELIYSGKRFESSQSKLWYAVYTVVRHEKAVNCSLLNNNIETFLPLREVVSQWKDRRKKVRLPLFPGYMFVRICDKDSRSILSILNTKGVVRILSSNRIFQPVPAQQIDSIKRLVEKNVEYDPYPYLVKGIEVAIVNGPLQGVTGKILERKGQNRLIVSIDIIKRSVSVKVDPANVELV